MDTPRTTSRQTGPEPLVARPSRRRVLRLWAPALTLTLVGFVVAWFCMEPAPPESIVIATGSPRGAYYDFAQRYARVFAEHGVTLEVRSTDGSVENGRLLDEDPAVDLAIVQGGVLDSDDPGSRLESLASLYLEPLWVFYRGDDALTDLRQLAGRRVAVGRPGSGTRALAVRLLHENELLDESAPALELDPSGGTEAADRLQAGTVDAAVFVISPQSDVVEELLAAPGVRLMSFARHAAYQRRHPFLSSVTLRAGVVDLARNLPPQDVHLVAPAANLVATPRLHDAFVPLLLEAARRVHGGGDRISEPERFPSRRFVEFPLNRAASHWFENGPSFLQRIFPFWIASAIDRGKILLLPALTLLLPLVKVAPPVYRWRIRSSIYKWYALLRDIDQQLRETDDTAALAEHESTLRRLERELDEVSVPLSYMEEFYNLRLHIDLVRRQLESRTGAKPAGRSAA